MSTKNSDYVCRNLALTAWIDGKYLRLKIEDPLDTTEAEISAEMGSSTLASRAYHLKEAIVIGIRQLVEQGWELGMFKVDLSKLPVPPAKPMRSKLGEERLSFVDEFMVDDIE